MNYPEHRDIIVFDDSVFEVGDTVKITTLEDKEYAGTITSITKDHFFIENDDSETPYFYDQIKNMELTCLCV